MTEAEERDYCLNHCPFSNNDGCSPCCEIFNRGQGAKRPVPAASRKRQPPDFPKRRERGRELLLAGAGKRMIALQLDVSYSSVQRWEAQLVQEGKFAKPRDLRKGAGGVGGSEKEDGGAG